MFDKYVFGAIRKFDGFGQPKAQDSHCVRDVFARENSASPKRPSSVTENDPYPRRVLDKRIWAAGQWKESVSCSVSGGRWNAPLIGGNVDILNKEHWLRLPSPI